ncbi:MAG: rhamnulokinase, partial [Clostridia bacterium]|nr:rhamnulokinase [Clostridia bacterium]
MKKNTETFLAIDIGASSGRHILGRLEEGRLVLDEIYRFSNLPQSSGGRLVWNAERLFAEVVGGLKRAKELGKIPRFVGIDTWGVDYALLDKHGALLGDVISYRDLRTEAAVPKVHARVPFETLYEKTGIQFQPFNTVYQLYCDREEGKLDKAEYLLMLPDWLHYKLTGRMSREYTDATTTGLMNARARTWDREIIKELGYPEKLFPEISVSGTKLGGFSKEIAQAVGYDAEVVLLAAHDTASAVVAAPFGGMYLSSGTWSLLGAECAEPITNEVARSYNYTNEGHLTGVRLQKNIMGLWMIQQIRHETGDAYSFAQFERMARESVNDCVVDVNDNRFLSPESMLREVETAVGKKLSAGEAAYCVFHSLALSYGDAVREFEAITGKQYSSLNIIG